MTCWNWEAFSPMRRSTSSLAADILVVPPLVSSARRNRTDAVSTVSPVPRALGRVCVGLRVMRQRTPSTSNTNSTNVSVVGSAKWLRTSATSR